MRDPQVKLKGGIVRVNLDSGMSQVVLVLHMVSGTWFSVARGFICREEMHEAFIRLEKLHCKVPWKVNGELTWPGLAGVGQWIMIAIIMRWFFPIGIFHGKSLCHLCCCLSYLFLLAFYYYVHLTLTTGIKALVEDQ